MRKGKGALKWLAIWERVYVEFRFRHSALFHFARFMQVINFFPPRFSSVSSIRSLLPLLVMYR